jgi:hypothetical protein
MKECQHLPAGDRQVRGMLVKACGVEMERKWANKSRNHHRNSPLYSALQEQGLNIDESSCWGLEKTMLWSIRVMKNIMEYQPRVYRGNISTYQGSNMPWSGRKGESASASMCSRQQGMKRVMINELLIPYYIMLCQGWGGGKVWGGEVEKRWKWLGPSYGLSQIPPAAHLTNFYLLC